MTRWPSLFLLSFVFVCTVGISSAKIGGWDTAPNTQYHIQTDEGPERYFKYQTISGQYRKEKRLKDGSVVGTYGWVDANGYLRLRDYVADDKGYRIVRSKMVKVDEEGKGVEEKKIVSTTTEAPPSSASPLPPISLADYLRGVDTPPTSPPTTTPAPYVSPHTYRPFYNPNSLDYNNKLYESVGAARFEDGSGPTPAPYDGISLTHNGFRYYLPRHYHEEETLPGDKRSGSFGYIDPFGIRRVVYYNTSPGRGFVHRKNNRYVGFRSTPYDPRF